MKALIMRKSAAFRSFSVKLFIVLFSAVAIMMIYSHSKASIPSQNVYLPLVANSNCEMEEIINGDFEQDDYGWNLSSTGMGGKKHDLIGSLSEGFSPYRGEYSARLGGYEGVWDVITQTITVPSGGTLAYWWKMGTYENLPHSDNFIVSLLQPDGTIVATLARHDDQDIAKIWQEDVIDVSGYAGYSYILQFLSYNDNYYFTWFDVDEVHLCGSK